MKSYIGCKIIQAKREDQENGERMGRLMIKKGYKMFFPDGYVLWSPKNVFENIYREITPEEKEFINY